MIMRSDQLAEHVETDQREKFHQLVDEEQYDQSIGLAKVIPDPSTGQRREVKRLVRLVTTRPHFGGVRWWFVDGGERVRCLYLLAGGDRFRSRRAHGLVYETQYRQRAKLAVTEAHAINRLIAPQMARHDIGPLSTLFRPAILQIPRLRDIAVPAFRLERPRRWRRAGRRLRGGRCAGL